VRLNLVRLNLVRLTLVRLTLVRLTGPGPDCTASAAASGIEARCGGQRSQREWRYKRERPRQWSAGAENTTEGI